MDLINLPNLCKILKWKQGKQNVFKVKFKHAYIFLCETTPCWPDWMMRMFEQKFLQDMPQIIN